MKSATTSVVVLLQLALYMRTYEDADQDAFGRVEFDGQGGSLGMRSDGACY
jgi:hypothetical protein